MKKILLIGTHGQSNWGDDILLETFLTQLGNENMYFVNSYDPAATQKNFSEKFNITCFHTTKNKKELVKFIFECDVVLFAGGTILRELYKNSNRNKYGSLLMILGLTFFARYIARKNIIMSNIGVGPLPSKLGRFLAGVSLNTTSLVSFRDKQSMSLAKACNLNNKIDSQVVPDSVFVNDKDFFVNKKYLSTESGDKIKIGLNLVYDIAKPEYRGPYLNVLKETFLSLLGEKKMEVIPVPMQIDFNKNNDIVEIDNFLKTLDIRKDSTIPKSPQELALLIDGCSLIIGARYHAVVISAILGVPIIPLLYDVKVRSLVERLQIEDYAININAEVSSVDIKNKINLLLTNRVMLSEHLIKTSSSFKKELESYFEKIRKIIND